MEKQALQHSVMYSTIFKDEFAKTLSQQIGSSSIVLSRQIATVKIIIGPPLPLKYMPTRNPSSKPDSLSSNFAEIKNPLTIMFSISLLSQQTKKYFLDYLYLFLSLAAFLLFARFLYLVYLRTCNPHTLASSAGASYIYEPMTAPLSDPETQSHTLKALDRDNTHRRDIYKGIDKSNQQDLLRTLRRQESFHETNISQAISRAVRDALLESQSSTKYPREFYEYLYMKYTLLDVEALYFPLGLYLPFMSTPQPVGWFEDLILYIMQNHKLISCILVPQGSPVGGIEKTQIFCMKGSLAFALTSFLGLLLVSSGIARTTKSPIVVVFNIFCVSPIALGVELFALRITRAFTYVDANNPNFKLQHPIWSFFILTFSRFSVLLIVILCLFLLVVASYFSTQKSPTDLVVTYVFQVLTPSALFDALQNVLALYPYSHVNIALMDKFTILLVGKRYCESLRWNNRQEVIDFTVTKYRLLCGFICIDVVRDVLKEGESPIMLSTGEPRDAWVKEPREQRKQKVLRILQTRGHDLDSKIEPRETKNYGLSVLVDSKHNHPSQPLPASSTSLLSSSGTKRLSVTQVAGAPQINPLIASDRRQSLNQSHARRGSVVPLSQSTTEPQSFLSSSPPFSSSSSSSFPSPFLPPLPPPYPSPAVTTSPESPLGPPSRPSSQSSHQTLSFQASDTIATEDILTNDMSQWMHSDVTLQNELKCQSEFTSNDDETLQIKLTNKGRNTDIGSRVALFETLAEIGNVDEETKTKARGEAHKRHLSVYRQRLNDRSASQSTKATEAEAETETQTERVKEI